MSKVKLFLAALAAVCACGANDAQAQSEYFVTNPGSVTQVTYFTPRELTVEVHNGTGETVQLFRNGWHVGDFRPGAVIRLPAPEGDVVMEAYKTSSQKWLKQTIHEHRDFRWLLPTSRTALSKPEPPTPKLAEPQRPAQPQQPKPAVPKKRQDFPPAQSEPEGIPNANEAKLPPFQIVEPKRVRPIGADSRYDRPLE